MKTILMAVAALVLLGGGGAGAYFYFFTSTAEAAEGEEAHVEEHAEEEHDPAHFEFVELDPMILPIVDNNGLAQTVSLVVVLEVMNHEAAVEVETMAPRLKDAYIQDMYGVLNRHAALKGGVIQVAHIKKRLNNISQKVMGEDKINDVLLQVVQQRPI